MKQTTQSSSFPSLSRRTSNTTLTSGENRFIFKRRLFRHSREISQDPIEVNLLYAQAVYSVVKVRIKLNYDNYTKIYLILSYGKEQNNYSLY